MQYNVAVFMSKQSKMNITNFKKVKSAATYTPNTHLSEILFYSTISPSVAYSQPRSTPINLESINLGSRAYTSFHDSTVSNGLVNKAFSEADFGAVRSQHCEVSRVFKPAIEQLHLTTTRHHHTAHIK